MKSLNELIGELKKLNSGLFANDFLLTWDKTEDELKQTLLMAEALKLLRDHNI